MNFALSRRALLSLTAGMIAIAAGTATARADYPKGTITAIVPFTPGGTSDALARLFSNKLNDMLGNTVIVENRPGASGNIGIAATAHAKPDGLTVMFSSSAVVWNPALFNHLEFDPVKDIVAVARLGDSAQVINVNAAKFPTQSLKEIVQYAKDHPGEVNVAASGVGLVEAYFEVQNGVDFEIIPYNSSSDAMTALMSGEADIFMGSALNVVPVMSTGKIRPVAVTGPKRFDVLPDVPTTTEAGMPDIQINYLFGAFVPGGTPPELVEQLNAAFNAISADPEVIAQMKKLGWDPQSISAGEFETQYKAEIEQWKAVAQKAGIKPLD